MAERNRVIESKNERQKTLDKLSIKSGRAYTYDTRDEKEKGSGCLSEAHTGLTTARGTTHSRAVVTPHPLLPESVRPALPPGRTGLAHRTHPKRNIT